jgi:hypothetical protein
MKYAMTPERIGISPLHWKLDPQDEAIIKAVDGGIRDMVRLMCAGGFETCESCQGGKGHSYPEPTIVFSGNEGEGYRAVAWLLTHGITKLQLKRRWDLLDRNILTGPLWEVVFIASADAAKEEKK